MTKVLVSSVLADYTGDLRELEAKGKTVGALLDDLDARYPGFRFRIVDEQDRIRPHMRIWLGDRWAESMSDRLPKDAEVNIFHALSGG